MFFEMIASIEAHLNGDIDVVGATSQFNCDGIENGQFDVSNCWIHIRTADWEMDANANVAYFELPFELECDIAEFEPDVFTLGELNWGWQFAFTNDALGDSEWRIRDLRQQLREKEFDA